jgi:hypothetical protein
MQEALQKLIKNVENITMHRFHTSTEICDKMRELDLIDEQRVIVNSILSRFDDDNKS